MWKRSTGLPEVLAASQASDSVLCQRTLPGATFGLLEGVVDGGGGVEAAVLAARRCSVFTSILPLPTSIRTASFNAAVLGRATGAPPLGVTVAVFADTAFLRGDSMTCLPTSASAAGFDVGTAPLRFTA